MNPYFIHPTAIVEDNVTIHLDVRVWHHCHVRTGAVLNQGVTLGKGVFIDKDVSVGKYSKIQNGISIYSGVVIEDFCFVGPHAIFTNDPTPRSYVKNWNKVPTFLKTGSSIGAGSIIRCGVSLGEFSLVGAGSIVTKDVEPFHLVYGQPAEKKAMICACGKTQLPLDSKAEELVRECCAENLMPEMLEKAQLTLLRL
jgi:acyl-[acyl carrier protein]--UDP-N-acetylglucosamine O-acyltransferase